MGFSFRSTLSAFSVTFLLHNTPMRCVFLSGCVLFFLQPGLAQTSTTVTIDSSSPVVIASFKVGDTVTIMAELDTSDPNEESEGEDLVITTTLTGSTTISTYSQPQTIVLPTVPAGGTVSAYIIDADGDESATITINIASNCSAAVPTPIPSPPGCPVQGWTRNQKIIAGTVAVASAAVGAVMNVGSVTGLICGPAAPACVAALNFGGIGLAALNGELGVFAGVDPPDQNFMAIAQPMIPTLTPVVAQSGITPAIAAALNALNANDITGIAYAQAAVTSGNRATGAADAGNAFWEAAQFQAEQNYANTLVSLIQAEPSLLANLQNALIATGHGSVTVTVNDVIASETAIAANGLPASVVQVLTQAGLDGSAITLLTNLLIGMNANNVAGTFPSLLTNPSLASAVQNFISALQIPVGLGQCTAFPVTLSSPAGPTGDFITISTSDPTTVELGPEVTNTSFTVFVPSGATTPVQRMPEVCGINLGSATVAASGVGVSVSRIVQVTAALSLTPSNATTATNAELRLTLSLSGPAPAGGLTVNLSSDNTSVATVPTTVTIPANTSSVIVQVTGVAPGSTLIHASALPNVPDTSANVTIL